MAGAVDRLKQKADAFQRRNRPVGFIYGVIKKMGDDKGGQLAALITYYGFFSLFPLLLVAFTVLGYVLSGNPSLRNDVSDTINQQLPIPGISADTISGSGLALVIGIVLTLWSGLGATQVAQDALNTVWDVPRGQQPSFIAKRLAGLLTLLVIGAGLIVATAASSAVSFLGPGAAIGGLAISVVINAAIMALLFRLMVERSLSWAEVLPGALFGGVAWTALQSLGGWYTNRLIDNADKTYGTFAVVIGLLSWIYLQCQMFIYAAEISSVKSRGLWPRALVEDDPTDADRAVLNAIIERSRPHVPMLDDPSE